jgi:hypothetical protein
MIPAMTALSKIRKRKRRTPNIYITYKCVVFFSLLVVKYWGAA